MKESWLKTKSFIAFELPSDKNYLADQFIKIHSYGQKESPEWSTSATRRRMIGAYWYSNVIPHFLLLMALPVLIFAPFHFESSYLNGILLAGFVSFFVLFMFNYLPEYTFRFLPRLETVKEDYDHGQKQLIEKCRKSQLSNLALCLIFYVFDKTNELNWLQPNDYCAGILQNVFGVDRASLKDNLELVIGGSSKRKNLSERKRTENQNRFDQANQFFGEIGFAKGQQILKDLEVRISSR